MEVIDNVYVLSRTERGILANLGLFRPDDMCNAPNPKDLFIISLTIFLVPEMARRNDDRIVAHCREKNKKLRELGLISEATFSRLKEVKSENTYFDIAIRFPNLETAEAAFEKMISAEFLDIYLYANEELVRKYG